MPLSLSRARSNTKGSVDRAQFLRGNWRGVVDAVRPPWALEGDRFFKTCTQCRECIAACPEKILNADKQGYPLVDFHRGECTFCGDCERTCKSLALKDRGQAPWSHHAQINNRCLALQGVMCRSCADNCDSRAIRFQLAVGGFSSPEINLDHCNGCGACIAPCPVGSIEITYKSTEK